MIDKLIEKKITVSVSFIDKDIKRGIINRYEPSVGLIEMNIDNGVLVIPLTSVVHIYYGE